MSYERRQSLISASSFLLSTSGFASAFDDVDTSDESVVASRCSMSDDSVDLILSIL